VGRKRERSISCSPQRKWEQRLRVRAFWFIQLYSLVFACLHSVITIFKRFFFFNKLWVLDLALISSAMTQPYYSVTSHLPEMCSLIEMVSVTLSIRSSLKINMPKLKCTAILRVWSPFCVKIMLHMFVFPYAHLKMCVCIHLYKLIRTHNCLFSCTIPIHESTFYLRCLIILNKVFL
jgi:hypothetical protein